MTDKVAAGSNTATIRDNQVPIVITGLKVQQLEEAVNFGYDALDIMIQFVSPYHKYDEFEIQVGYRLSDYNGNRYTIDNLREDVKSAGDDLNEYFITAGPSWEEVADRINTILTIAAPLIDAKPDYETADQCILIASKF